MPPAGGLRPPSEQDEEEEKIAKGQGVVFVLEDAQLEVAQVGKAYVLLNCDDHATYIKKHKKDPSLYRPDICHQALLSILDSPLNKAGKVKAIYLRTAKNVIISVNPKVRIPRTFRRFCGLMAQLLQKLSIRATNGPDKLMKVIKGPVTKYLPLDCTRLGFSWASDKKVAIHEYVRGLPDSKPVVFVVGAFAHGKIDAPWVDTNIAISEYPLSAAYVLARITNAFEQKWGIV
uniref:Ribosomal RNA small subunit methyltransferase NEP1 n=1 Tax=Chlamydomonas leiostraca TaxID=1034604 RepID=A0A7S0RIM2_9CHLO|mmetsp:Transcript_22973/g.58748  ORF Transcript_22973/g.58748 Transcript_22973/m.58748 type:complete len:232 (+) Transcript_22973:68-763(+)